MAKRHINELLRTPSGRLAGSGMLYDRYDDESMAPEKYTGGRPILTKEYSDKRFENAKKVFNDEGYEVELLNVSDNVDIFEVYGL